MTQLWIAFGLLIVGFLVTAWCVLSTLYGRKLRSGDQAIANETKFACILAALVIGGAFSFAIAAYLSTVGGPT